MDPVNFPDRTPENQLLAATAQGDQRAFNDLYSRTSGRLFALIVQILLNHAQSEEVLQEVFVEVWRLAPSFDATRGNAMAWMATIARRRAIDRVRSSQSAKNREAAYTEYMPDADSTVIQVEERLSGQHVREALDEVGEPWKSAIILSYFTGLTHSQIAHQCRIPVGTVKTRIFQGIKKLRAVMEVQNEHA
ncbi:sigma-70 family RNA polymerase sigma factor [Corynebacterium sp. HS2168-gen11]|uniref:sigma-70 family RNA polymerase sigma factor n=1 Tax=Corynebacterium sp. HS2168-gen11 TaxID=2974027 RepID=UPI0037BEFF56